MTYWNRSEATSVASGCPQTSFTQAGERFSMSRYVHCLCPTKSHMFLNNEKLICHLFNEPIFSMFCHINKWPRQLSIIRAYAHQYTRARRQLRLLDRPGGWALKVWSFQDVRRPRGPLPDTNKQITCIYAFSLSCLQIKNVLKCGRPTTCLQNLFYCIGMYVLSFASSFECFYVFCFGWEIYENSSSRQARRQQEVNDNYSLLGVNFSKAHSDGR